MKNFVLSVVFGCVCLLSNGQVNEELIESKIDSAWDLLQNGPNIEEALLLSNELLEIGNENSHYRAQVMAYQIKGEAYYFLAQANSAFYWNEKAFDLAEKNEDRTEMAYSSRSIAGNNGEKGNLNAAMERFDESLSIWKELKDTSEVIFTQLKKGDLLNRADNHVFAMRSYANCI